MVIALASFEPNTLSNHYANPNSYPADSYADSDLRRAVRRNVAPDPSPRIDVQCPALAILLRDRGRCAVSLQLRFAIYLLLRLHAYLLLRRMLRRSNRTQLSGIGLRTSGLLPSSYSQARFMSLVRRPRSISGSKLAESSERRQRGW